METVKSFDTLHPSQLPEDARELEKELRQITKEKNEASHNQEFEKVRNIWAVAGPVNTSFGKGAHYEFKSCYPSKSKEKQIWEVQIFLRR